MKRYKYLLSILLTLFLLPVLAFGLWFNRQVRQQRLAQRYDPDLIAAIRAGDAEHVENLLARGDDPNMADATGRPIITLVNEAPVVVTIHAVSMNGSCQTIEKHKNHPEIVRLLVKHGANVNVKSAEGWTPLLQAQAADDADLVAFLKQAGATR